MTRKGRDVKEDKDKSLKDQILVIAPHKGFVPSDIWLRCRKKLMTNTTFQNGRKARNTWLAGKINAENVATPSKPHIGLYLIGCGCWKLLVYYIKTVNKTKKSLTI